MDLKKDLLCMINYMRVDVRIKYRSFIINDLRILEETFETSDFTGGRGEIEFSSYFTAIIIRLDYLYAVYTQCSAIYFFLF